MSREPDDVAVRSVPRAPFAGALLVVLVSSLPRVASAQLQSAWELSAGVGQANAANGLTTQRALGGALRFDRPYGSIEANGGVRDTGRTWLGDAGLRALLATPGWAGFRLSVGADVRHVAAAGQLPFAFRTAPLGVLDRPAVATAWTTTGTARLSYARGRAGAWVGADVPRASADSEPGTARLGLGLWRELRETVISFRVGSRAARLGGRTSTLRSWTETVTRWDTTRVADSVVMIPHTITETKTAGDSGAASQLRRWAEAELQVGWTHGRFALDGVVGARPRVSTRRPTTHGASTAPIRDSVGGGVAGAVALAPSVWAQATGSYAVGARLALVGGVGIVPAVAALPTGRSRFVTFGVRLAPPALRRAPLPDGVRPSATGFAIRSVTPGEYVVALRAPGARVVELSGDFTGWQPIALREVAAGRWEATVRMTPGTHRCNVRIDGDRWIAPAGTTPVEDDFNGRVGLIVAP